MTKKPMENKFNKWSTKLVLFMFLLLAFPLLMISAFAQDTTSPTIIKMLPQTDQLDVGTHSHVTVWFNEPMDERTINENTFVLEQRTTPVEGSEISEYRSIKIDGSVFYDGVNATFTPDNGTLMSYNQLQPDQEFGNVFTATITTGVKDLKGNSLARDFLWSFSTGDSSFYEDTTTSAQNQTPLAVIPASPVTKTPANIAPVAENPAMLVQQTETRSSLWWLWILAGIILLVLIALLYWQGSDSETIVEDTHLVKPFKQLSPFGDIHPVIDIEGIGDVYNEELQKIGIVDTRQLWNADAGNTASKIGAPLSLVKGWQHMAELASIKGIGPQYAELLQRSGIHSISQLKNADPDELLKGMRHKQRSLKIDIQGNTVGHATVEHWIDAAQNHKFSRAEAA